jgi:hypothetical protein
MAVLNLLWKNQLQAPLAHCDSCLVRSTTQLDLKNAVFWDIQNPVCTSQETHYFSATESSQLMLCKIWGFHGSDYEECRLLGYKNPFRTSQETHYFSTTGHSQLMLCKIWGFHGGHYEECRLLGCYAVWLLQKPKFRRNVSPPSSGWQESAS